MCGKDVHKDAELVGDYPKSVDDRKNVADLRKKVEKTLVRPLATGYK
jgi:hypothetical protein